MSNEVEFDFSNEIQKGRWELLAPHHKRGAVFVVNDPLDLQTVGHALAKDKASIVKIWLDNGDPTLCNIALYSRFSKVTVTFETSTIVGLQITNIKVIIYRVNHQVE